LDGAILPNADLSGRDFSYTSLQYANLDNVNFTGSDFSYCNLTDVRIEETTSVQSISVTPGGTIIALYYDGVIREWEHNRLQGQKSTNLYLGIKGNEIKLFVQPGNDLTILHDRFIYFCDKVGNELKRKATIEIDSNINLIKATKDSLLLKKKIWDLLKEDILEQDQLLLVDLNKQAVVKSFTSSPFTLCDNLDNHAFVIVNKNSEFQIIDITTKRRKKRIISIGERIACLATRQCRDLEGQYLLGLGLFNGSVQIWQINVHDWECKKLSELSLHKLPVKDIDFIDENCVVSGGLDTTIKMFTLNHERKLVGEPKEFKMTLQCCGMKIKGVVRDIEQKRLQELINKAVQEPG
jgi:WD40 repeat protein